MKAALLQFDPTVGALDQNADRLIDLAREAASRGATLAVSSELSLVGYPPRDLLERREFLRQTARATARVVESIPAGLTLIFGTVGGTRGGRPVRLEEHLGSELLGNDALVATAGCVRARARKQLLPTYDVFDEARYFSPGKETTIVEIDGIRVAITICEDAWGGVGSGRYGAEPLARVKGGADGCADLLVNLSASPFTLPKHGERERVFQALSQNLGLPTLLANQVGGNDELVFDGRSTAWSAEGNVIARAPMFEEALCLVDVESSTACPPTQIADEELVYRALVLGIRDYARKCGFKKAVLGLSGGIDSALTAVLAADALGPANVIGIAMPTRFSSEGSVVDARALAENVGIQLHLVDIDPIFQATVDGLTPLLENAGKPGPADVTLENLQARIRGATVMACSNRSGALVLTTGNKSELAVGYCTLYGDMVGGLAVISDLPKTMVYLLSRWINRDGERIPWSSIEKPPSAELAHDQKDEDSLPAYEVLDRVLELSVEQGESRAEILARGLDPESVELVLRLLRTNEYKRRQAAPGLIITRKAFGVGRRMPIAQGFRE